MMTVLWSPDEYNNNPTQKQITLVSAIVARCAIVCVCCVTLLLSIVWQSLVSGGIAMMIREEAHLH